MHEMVPLQKNLAGYWKHCTGFFPILLMNIHLKQTETLKTRPEVTELIETEEFSKKHLKYVSSKHSYKKQLLVFYLLNSI